jgi:hypothetical protein
MLATYVLRVEYEFADRVGCLFQEDRCCCDMTACIEFFKKIDPQVRYIRTMAGDEEDTSYRRGSDGRWQAFLPSRNQFQTLPLQPL